MGNNASFQSAKEDRPIPEASKANGWGNMGGEGSHSGWGPPGVSAVVGDQGWVDKPGEARYNGWGERAALSKDDNEKCASSKPRLPEVSSHGWMDEPAKEEYGGWSTEPARKEFNGWADEAANDDYHGWGVPRSMLTNNPVDDAQITNGVDPLSDFNNDNPTLLPPAPSAPPIPEEMLREGTSPVPHIDSSPMAVPPKTHESLRTNDAGEETSSLCIICWEAPVEGACVPCGHMAGCVPCLSEIQSKKGNCPVCRAKIDQVIKLYIV